ncbi:uncharacterized protein LOC113522287 [Galleria mellonella]|uniref:Uncharacterized protein LOC113522287 n=1 Tax=Galleria mellonella TaxID=7137 RepID=A0ABM3MYV8_GALME|nr:uncharacterized protein LOC113522287 [Galleria mellonella]
MESLNMSQLNLSSVRSHTSKENEPKVETTVSRYNPNPIIDPDEEYHTEYREEIWKNLLEQEAEKPTIHLQSPQNVTCVSPADVRLVALESVDVGCACVACARAGLQLAAWPAWLAARAGRDHAAVAPVARLLQKMMQMVKSRETQVDTEADQGYSSAHTSPNLTPCTSPYQVSPASSTCSTSYLNDYRQRPVETDTTYSVLDLNDSAPTAQDYRPLQLPTTTTCQRVDNPSEYRYCRSNRLVDASIDTVQPSNSMAVKRGLDTEVEVDRKRYRYANQMSQVIL